MPSLVVVRRFPQGPRVWLCGQRVHHGASGLVFAALLLRSRRRVAAACLLAVLHDRHDWRVWFAREVVPAGGTLDSVPNVA